MIASLSYTDSKRSNSIPYSKSIGERAMMTQTRRRRRIRRSMPTLNPPSSPKSPRSPNKPDAVVSDSDSTDSSAPRAFSVNRQADDEKKKTVSEYTRQIKSPSVNSQRGIAKRKTDEEEAANWQPEKHIPIGFNVTTVSMFGYTMPDIKYGSLGKFPKLSFGNEEEVTRSLHWLETM